MLGAVLFNKLFIILLWFFTAVFSQPDENVVMLKISVLLGTPSGRSMKPELCVLGFDAPSTLLSDTN